MAMPLEKWVEEQAKLFEINEASWKDELRDIEKFLNQFGNCMPSEIWQEHKKFAEQLNNNGNELEGSICYGDRGGA